MIRSYAAGFDFLDYAAAVFIAGRLAAEVSDYRLSAAALLTGRHFRSSGHDADFAAPVIAARFLCTYRLAAERQKRMLDGLSPPYRFLRFAPGGGTRAVATWRGR